MSLVNLAHVCSHLQNASLARLGLTSIPYSKLHLSFALLLQRQGFLSQVKLGGRAPPASCFGNGQPDNHQITNHVLSSEDRRLTNREAALSYKVRNGAHRSDLEAAGFPSVSIEFAEKHATKSHDELIANGFQQRAHAVVRSVRRRIDDEVEALAKPGMGIDPTAENAGKEVSRLREEQTAYFRSQLRPAERRLLDECAGLPLEEIASHTFSFEALQAYAGPAASRTLKDIENHGITIEAMGLEVDNQPITLRQPEYADPHLYDEEGVVTQANRASRRLWLGLKYHNSMPVLTRARLVSKPTKRIWLSSRELGGVVRGKAAGEVKGMRQIGEILAISTDRGIMEARDCVERRIGGQVLARVW